MISSGKAYEVTFVDDPTAFLDRAGDRLAAEPVTSTVVATIATRLATATAAELGDTSRDLPYRWFAIVTGPDGDIAGVAMRTARFAPYPLYVLTMPDAAATALADAVLGRGEAVGAVNGARPAVDVVAGVVADRIGGRVEVDRHTRLFLLGDLVEPRPVAGRLRSATADEAPLLLEWFRAFHGDADEQVDRPPTHEAKSASLTPADMAERIRTGRVWIWVDDDDRPVHLTAANPPAYGVARIGPVYTPKEHRGNGYASAGVATVSRLLRDQGERVTLFTDQANPTSNAIYIALGYEAVVDQVELLIS